MTNAASQAVAQLGYGNNNLHGTAEDMAFKTRLLEQMHKMNQQMQEQNMHLSMAKSIATAYAKTTLYKNIQGMHDLSKPPHPVMYHLI